MPMKLDIGEIYDNLSSHKKQLLLEYLKKKAIENKVLSSGEQEIAFSLTSAQQELVESLRSKGFQVEDAYPITPMQQSMLVHNLFSSPELAVQQNTYRVKGDLNVAVLKKALQILIERHAILRTSFWWHKLEEPLQIVMRTVELNWLELDWSHLEMNSWEAEIDRYLVNDRSQRFDLSKPPLIRMAIIRLNPTTYQIIWSYFNSLLDGWSSALFIEELDTLYQELLLGKKSTLSKAPSFKSYVQWLMTQKKEVARKFWVNEFSYNVLPSTFIRQVGSKDDDNQFSDNYIPAQQQLELSIDETTVITHFLRYHGLTLSALFQGVWALYWAALDEEETVLLGMAVSGRNNSISGIDRMLGLLTNTLPILLRIQPHKRILTWIQDIQKKQSQILRFEYVTVKQIAQWSRIDYNLIRRAIFHRTLVILNYPQNYVNNSMMLSCKPTEKVVFGQLNLPLRLYVIPGHSLSLSIKYNKKVYQNKFIKQLLQEIGKVLLQISNNPEQLVDNVLIHLKVEGKQWS